MTIAAREFVSPVILLRLGRVSNLPTVWTNVLAGAVLGGGDWQSWRLSLVLVAMSLFYIGGMYLNDYFDRCIDALDRPERPIPSGAISARAVAAIGFGLLGAGLTVTAAIGSPLATAIAALLAGAIVAYDLRHKGKPLAPIVMGACRALIYAVAAAVMTGSISTLVIAAGLATAAYVAGLTSAARQESLDKIENLWTLALLLAPMVVAMDAFRQGPAAITIYLLLVAWNAAALYLLARRPGTGSVSRAVGWLIAGLSLCDAAMLASVDAIVPALAAIGGFLATLFAQRYVAGT
jgi:4-hydroxybenzoate polyprenyltransferase